MDIHTDFSSHSHKIVLMPDELDVCYFPQMLQFTCKTTNQKMVEMLDSVVSEFRPAQVGRIENRVLSFRYGSHPAIAHIFSYESHNLVYWYYNGASLSCTVSILKRISTRYKNHSRKMELNDIKENTQAYIDAL